MAQATPIDSTLDSAIGDSAIGEAADPLLARLAVLSKAAGEELRLQILRVLRRDSFGVLELAEIFDVRQSGMSHHLKVLADAGLVDRRREGNSIFYHRANLAHVPAMEGLQHSLMSVIDGLALSDITERRVQAVHSKRAQSSQQFFEAHADEFAEQQELICEFSVYAQPVLQLIDSLVDCSKSSVLEIGPGTGALIGELAKRFRRVIALDNSQEMLDACRRNYTQLPGNVELVLNDAQYPLGENYKVNNIVMNMVLHHVASPAELMGNAAELLQTDGRIFLAELCDHDQDWVRESCGDLWLGFAPEQINLWAERAGLYEPSEGQYLSLRNGFRIQIRQFQLAANATELTTH